MTAILKQLADLWRKLSATQRVLVCALLSLAVIGSLLASFVGASPSYVLLKDGLDPAALSDALAALDGAGVRRKVGSNRDEILVDERDFERAREVAAREKIFATSASDPEWEAAGSTSLGLTEEQRRRRDLLAKQKTLAKTLETYVGIERATVTLTPGSRGFSKREISPAKAAVVLKLKDGFLPDALQTEAIQRVVAAALPDLVADNVAISDTRGVLLSRGAGIAASGTPAFERKRYVERHLADKAQSALDLAFGAGRAQVRVDARLEMESLEESVRTLDPETQVKLQEKTTSSTGASRGAGGVVGADSQAKGASRDSGAGSSSEETSSTPRFRAKRRRCATS
jgi:flagellar M-ring protein FliF